MKLTTKSLLCTLALLSAQAWSASVIQPEVKLARCIKEAAKSKELTKEKRNELIYFVASTLTKGGWA
jgi:hypothetical protein